jgi:hypothetical protein
VLHAKFEVGKRNKSKKQRITSLLFKEEKNDIKMKKNYK